MSDIYSVEVTIKKQDWIADPKSRWNHGLSMAGKTWVKENKRNPLKHKGTGRMARESRYKITSPGKQITLISTFYWIFMMKGTGIYGPEKRPITPVHARALAWKSQGSGMLQVSSGFYVRKGSVVHQKSKDVYMIFARSVKGSIWPGRLDQIKAALRNAFAEGIKQNKDE